MKKRLAGLVLAAAMTATALTGCSSFDGDAVVMEIGDTKVPASVANFYARYQQSLYETYYTSFMGSDMWEGEAEEGKTYEESVKESILDNLQRFYVMDMHKEEYGVSLTEDDQKAIDSAVSKFTEANTLENKELVSGDDETVKKFLELITINNKVSEAIGDTVDTEVSDEEAAQKSMQYVYFSFSTTDEEGNSKEMTDEEKEKLLADAQAFREGALTAEDFAGYAEGLGYTASTQTFDAESNMLDEAVIQAADALGEGEVSEVTEASGGYYVMKLTSLLDREATDAKKETIVSERKQEAVTKACDAWLEEEKVTVHEDVWKTISFVKQGVTVKDTTSGGAEETEE